MLPADQLDGVLKRYDELVGMLGDPAVVTDPDRLRQVGQEQADLEPLVIAYREFVSVQDELAETKEMSGGDDDMAELVADELELLEGRRDELESHIEGLLVPADPLGDRNVIVEIRAGTGGDEAGLFASDLYRMYHRFADERRWKVDVLSQNQTGVGGYKEIIFEVRGKGVFSHLKFESGVHRVQRVPDTEASGRIHTSTATVAVLPEMDEIEVNVPETDVRVDVFRSSGPGGQSVNTTDSAVRLTHVPTGLVITCQDEKSQLQNRRKALQVLRARLYQIEKERQDAELGAKRKEQVGTGERSEKIRTYNFPQSRVTDHRIGLTSHRLEQVLGGELDEFVDALAAADHAVKLASIRSG